MASRSEEGKGWVKGFGGGRGAAEVIASSSGTSGALQGGGIGRAMQSLYTAE